MRKVAIAGVIAWTIGIGAGVATIYAHSTDPGAQLGAPATWPAESSIARPPGRSRIVMFVHPECPCSRASIAELIEIAHHVGDRAAIEIVSSGTGESWERAGEVPGAHRSLDPIGTEAMRFGARTSGHVVVYDVRGIRRYSGGITGSRGHLGDNVGRRTVEAIVDGAGPSDLGHVVFGCAL